VRPATALVRKQPRGPFLLRILRVRRWRSGRCIGRERGRDQEVVEDGAALRVPEHGDHPGVDAGRSAVDASTSIVIPSVSGSHPDGRGASLGR
jgi:hypothetical protein